MRVGRRGAILTILLALVLSAGAHEDLSERLADADARVLEADSVGARVGRASLFREAALYGYALRDLDVVAERNPAYRPAWFVRAEVKRDQADWAAAQDAWQRWSALGPPTGHGWQLHADILEGGGQPRAALDALDAAMAIAPSPDRALRRGRLAVQLGELDRAASGYAEAADRIGSPALRLALYELELGRDRPDAAIAQAAALLVMSPTHPDWLVLRAEARWAAGQHDAARDDWRAAAAVLDEQLAVRPTPQRQASRESISQALERR